MLIFHNCNCNTLLCFPGSYLMISPDSVARCSCQFFDTHGCFVSERAVIPIYEILILSIISCSQQQCMETFHSTHLICSYYSLHKRNSTYA